MTLLAGIPGAVITAVGLCLAHNVSLPQAAVSAGPRTGPPAIATAPGQATASRPQRKACAFVPLPLIEEIAKDKLFLFHDIQSEDLSVCEVTSSTTKTTLVTVTVHWAGGKEVARTNQAALSMAKQMLNEDDVDIEALTGFREGSRPCGQGVLQRRDAFLVSQGRCTGRGDLAGAQRRSDQDGVHGDRQASTSAALEEMAPGLNTDAARRSAALVELACNRRGQGGLTRGRRDTPRGRRHDVHRNSKPRERASARPDSVHHVADTRHRASSGRAGVRDSAGVHGAQASGFQGSRGWQGDRCRGKDDGTRSLCTRCRTST